MKKLMALLAAVLLLASLTACGKKKTRIVHCDHCGAEVEIDEDSAMQEDWVIICKSCAETMDPVVKENDTPFN